MMRLDLGVDELLTTTRSVRRRLDIDTPVPREVLMECLELALQAPNAADAQSWHWVFVRDAATKRALADIYRSNLGNYQSIPGQEPPSGGVRKQRLEGSGRHLVAHLHEAPVLLVPCLRGRVDNAPAGVVAGFWASLMPAVWSFCLALRSRGLGTCWTTLHLLGEGERKAADLLGIPFDEYSQAGLLPIAYTLGTDFTPADRLPAEQVTHFERW